MTNDGNVEQIRTILLAGNQQMNVRPVVAKHREVNLAGVERRESGIEFSRLLLDIGHDPSALQNSIRTGGEVLFLDAAEKQRRIMLWRRHGAFHRLAHLRDKADRTAFYRLTNTDEQSLAHELGEGLRGAQLR